jgi:hypothetical protein
MAFHTTRTLSKGRAAPKIVLHIDFLLLSAIVRYGGGKGLRPSKDAV